MLLILITACGSPRPSDLLGADAELLAQTKVDGATAMVGALPSGEWVTAIARGEAVGSQRMKPNGNHPMPFHTAGITVVAGRAPEGAVRYELLNESRVVLKGDVRDGVYLIAWPSAVERFAFILRLLDAKGNELYRWPPPGALPAA
ncbi:MAG: hypothetical protein ACOY93_02430 [Bacillota bacterium]